MKEVVIEYLKAKYHPRAMLVYGSYVREDQDEFSDFDCMLIVDEKVTNHDDTEIGGVKLDCFLFTADETVTEEPDTFLTAYDAEIVFDDGVGARLKDRVRQYVEEHTKIDDSEKEFIASWIKKTMKRMQKGDDEGNYRAVAFLWESLTDYYLLRDMFYFGSKKAIQYLKQNDIRGYEYFYKAITLKTNDSIREWAEYVTGERP